MTFLFIFWFLFPFTILLRKFQTKKIEIIEELYNEIRFYNLYFSVFTLSHTLLYIHLSFNPSYYLCILK